MTNTILVVVLFFSVPIHALWLMAEANNPAPTDQGFDFIFSFVIFVLLPVVILITRYFIK